MSNNTTVAAKVSSVTGSQSTGGSTALLGSTMLYFCSSDSNNVKIVSFDCSSLQSGDLSSLSNSPNWSEQHLSGVISHKNGASLKSNLGTAAVASSNRVYMFWVDSGSGDVYMCYQESDGTISDRAYAVKNLEGGSSKSYESTSSLAAELAPDGRSIVLLRVGNSTNLYSLILNPYDIDESGGSWAGVVQNNLMLSEVNGDIDSGYNQLSSAWYTHGSENWMLISLYSHNDHKIKLVAYPILDNGAPASTEESIATDVGHYSSARKGCSLTRDPAGRIIAIAANSSEDLTINTYSTMEAPSENASWSGFTNLFNVSADADVMGVPIFIASNTTSDQTVTGVLNGNSETYSHATTINQYLLVMYDDNLKVIADTYGKSVVVPGVSTITPTTANKDIRIMATLMDSFPFPNENLGSLAPSQYNSPIITYTYGASSATESSVGMKSKLQFGVKASVEAFVAQESEFRAGPMAEASYSTSAESIAGFSVVTTPILDSATGEARMSHNGEYFGSSLPEVVEDATIFIAADGTIANGDSAPLFSAFRSLKSVNTHRVSGGFSAYSYIPGNIQSYQKSEINTKMAELYNGLNAEEQSHLEPGYATNYIDNVILPRAQALGSDHYLEFTIDGAGGTNAGYHAVDQLMELLGMSIDGSFYVGESTDTSIGILVVSEEIKESFLVGMDFSMELTAESTTTNSWGLSSSFNTPKAVDGGYAYTVRMYLLEPSNLWAREMEYFGDVSSVQGYDSLDFVNSQPTKIMFEVMDIQSVISS